MIWLAMRRFLVCVVVALALPAVAQATARVVAFYYPWYGTAALDGSYQHWSQNGAHAAVRHRVVVLPGARAVLVERHAGARGADGRDPQRRDRRDRRLVVGAGLGRGSAPAGRAWLPPRADGIQVAAHLEPYAGRSVASIVADVAYLRALGITTFYVYRAPDFPAADWAAAKTALHQGGAQLLAQTPLAGWAAAAGFDGIYTYDILTYGGDKFARICNEAHAHAPALRAVGRARVPGAPR